MLVGNSWWQIVLAAFLAVMFTQIGFLSHDAGHRQICASWRVSYILGIMLGNVCIGLSFGWWVAKHNRHLAVVFLVLSPVKAVVFILVQQGLFGVYLGASFAPNHKGMPILREQISMSSCVGKC